MSRAPCAWSPYAMSVRRASSSSRGPCAIGAERSTNVGTLSSLEEVQRGKARVGVEARPQAGRHPEIAGEERVPRRAGLLQRAHREAAGAVEPEPVAGG